MTTQSMVQALQRLSGREMLINTETADEFLSNITRFADTEQANIAQLEVASREQLCMAYGFEDDMGDSRKPFVYSDGVAVIPIHGSLINRFGGSWGFVTGYNFIRTQLNKALADEDVKMIVYDVNSPGGEASGCFELAREMMLARDIKPSLSFVDSLACSGGMALAGSATKMYGIPSARIGSIGVYRQHVSIKKQLENDGVEITFASAGEHKLDGSPYEKLPGSVLKDWTEDANRTWDDFIALVADGRGMDPDAVRATQARIYRADEALALGLIDGVWTTTEAIAAFVAELDDDDLSDNEEDEQMSTKPEATSVVDYGKIAEMIGTAVGGAISNMTRSQNIAAHGKEKGQVALAAKLSANAAVTEVEAIEMIDAAAAAAAPAPKTTKVKGAGKPAKVSADNDGDEDEDDDDSEDTDEGDEGDEGDEDEDAEDLAEQARSARKGNKVKSGKRGNRVDGVNHLDRVMDTTGGGARAGGGSGKDGQKLTGDAAATESLLGDYAQHTGTVLKPRERAKA